MSVDTGVLGAATTRVAMPTVKTKEPPKKRERKVTPITNSSVAHPGIASRPRTGREGIKAIETKAFGDARAIPGVSVFAVFGTLVIALLMLLVVLAQINYNETANEAARLNNHLRELTEQHRVLEMAYESSYDIREVERIARDELGMSRPDATQMMMISARLPDTATVIRYEEEDTGMGFFDFLKSLTGYFKRN